MVSCIPTALLKCEKRRKRGWSKQKRKLLFAQEQFISMQKKNQNDFPKKGAKVKDEMCA